MPAECETSGCGVDKHQARINHERGSQTASGERQMRAAVKYVSGETADGEFEKQERKLAMLEQTSHKRVSFGRNVQPHPKNGQLGVEPVESKQEQAFGKCTHGFSVPTLFKLHPITSEPPKLTLGVHNVTGGTRLVLCFIKDGELYLSSEKR